MREPTWWFLQLAVLGALLLPPDAMAQSGSLRVTVPSPTAASLGEFGDVPVSLNTGVPDISVPLFTAVHRSNSATIICESYDSA